MAPEILTDEQVVPTNSALKNKPRIRILVPEKVSPDGLSLLTSDFEVDSRPGLSPEQLIELIPLYHGLIVRSETKVTSAVLAAGKQLRVVARAGVGVDNIDVDAATTHGIIVVNSPAGNIVAAAEHTVALLLATARNIGRADRSFKEGKWERGKLVGVEVGRKTLGVVGLGKVGMNVARMCTGLGMKVAAFDPYASADLARQAGIELVPRLPDLLPAADFLTIHTPLLASTLDLLGEPEFRAMKPTARVLNVARGGVYNEAALLRALDEGWIAGAGIDVFTAEPPEEGTAAARLARHEKVVATPHLGASTVEAQENVSLDVCAQVREVLRGGLPTSAVNAPLILPEEYRALRPFVRLVEKMGALYTQHYVRDGSSGSGGGGAGGGAGGGGGGSSSRFELVYHGDLAAVSNTRPLFAALVRGLLSPVSDAGGRDVNLVNAALVARSKGIVVDEVHARSTTGSSADGDDSAAGAAASPTTYASLVTLRALDDKKIPHRYRVIEGYVSGSAVYISRLDRFRAAFEPDGTLLILHNYDEPGKIGGVGSVLGRYGINIRFMQVASLAQRVRGGSGSAADAETVGDGEELRRTDSAVAGVEADGSDGKGTGGGEGRGKGKGEREKVNGGDNEALMILGVDGEVTREVLDGLESVEGILRVSLVRL
ncbi:phosphoglycerate dehydrogenase [Xylariaceae sp. FL0662B]|nr:phosphoglycerate dehydrogenase [Xylariaceae sp. FL0662B]